MFRYASPRRMMFIWAAVTTPLPETPPDVTPPDGTESVTMTSPFCPDADGPWMCAAVAPDARFENDPLTATVLALSLNDTITVPVPGLSLDGTSCAPVSSMLYVFCGQTATGL